MAHSFIKSKALDHAQLQIYKYIFSVVVYFKCKCEKTINYFNLCKKLHSVR